MAIWVADNGSTDDSVVWLKAAHADSVQVLELKENFGFAEGYNRALAQIDEHLRLAEFGCAHCGALDRRNVVGQIRMVGMLPAPGCSRCEPRLV